MKKIIWKFNTNFKYMIWYNFLNRLKKFHLIAKNVVLLVQTTHDSAILVNIRHSCLPPSFSETLNLPICLSNY